MFWPAPVRKLPFREHLRAAAAGGFTSLAIAFTTFDQARDGGLTVEDMLAMAADAGVALRHFDTLTAWAPFQLDPGDFDEEMNRRWRTTVEDGLPICERLGLTRILATAAYRRDGVPQQQLIDGFGRLCERAGRLGIWVDLEPQPFFGCPDVATAWSVVGGSGAANAGILADSWHFFKAPGQTLADLEPIPGRCFRTMQINDAPLRRICDKLIDDTIRHRRWPGEGELPLQEFLRAIAAKGHLDAVGQEVFSLEADAMPAEDAGRRAGETTWAALAAAGIAVPPPPRAAGREA